MKKVFLLLFYIIFIREVKAQIYHYVLQEVQLNIPGQEQKIVGFHGKNVKVILDLDRMTLSIPEIKNKTYNIRNLTLLGEDTATIMYKGISSQNGGNDWEYIHFIDKEDNWNIFQIESLEEKGVSMSYLCILSDTLIKTPITKSSGSGFFISTDGLIATNSHVIQDATKIEVVISNESGTFTYRVEVIFNSPQNDVAVLKINDNKFKKLNSLPYGISTNVEVGEKVFTIGYPLNSIMGENYKVTDGIISSSTGLADDERYYQISVPIQPGNSGGPLFNKDGNIIGITTATFNSKALNIQTQNVNYAIKGVYLLNKNNIVPLLPKSTLANKQLFEQVKVLKNYVCLIKVEY